MRFLYLRWTTEVLPAKQGHSAENVGGEKCCTSAFMGCSSSLVCTSLPSVSIMMATENLQRYEICIIRN